MSEVELVALAERVARLERKMRWWRSTAVFVLLMALVLGTGNFVDGQHTTAETVRARSFVVVNDGGEEIGHFKADATGEPTLWLGSDAGEVGLGVYKAQGPRVALWSRRDVGGCYRCTAWLQITPSGEPRLRLLGDGAHVEIASPKGLDGSPRAVLGSVSVADSAGRALRRPLSSLVLLADNGRVMWTAP